MTFKKPSDGELFFANVHFLCPSFFCVSLGWHEFCYEPDRNESIVMKKSKITKSNAMEKIIKMISRNEQMDRNGGGQWVSTHRVHRSKKQYSRKRFKRDTKQALDNA